MKNWFFIPLLRLVSLVAVLCITPNYLAQSPGAKPKALRPSGLTLGQLTSKPRIDGVISAGEWDGAAKATLDIQIEPGDNIAASERTEAFLAADHETLYVCFHAYDSDPSAIRAVAVLNSTSKAS